MKKNLTKTKTTTKAAIASRGAMEVAAQYSLLLTPHPEGGFSGNSVEMPLVFGRGATHASCAEDTQFAIALTIDHIREAGERPPAPASMNRRDVQVNVRVTPDERLRIGQFAKDAGYRSISDYMRRAALRGVA